LDIQQKAILFFQQEVFHIIINCNFTNKQLGFCLYEYGIKHTLSGINEPWNGSWLVLSHYLRDVIRRWGIQPFKSDDSASKKREFNQRKLSGTTKVSFGFRNGWSSVIVVLTFKLSHTVVWPHYFKSQYWRSRLGESASVKGHKVFKGIGVFLSKWTAPSVRWWICPHEFPQLGWASLTPRLFGILWALYHSTGWRSHFSRILPYLKWWSQMATQSMINHQPV
jgi:hypothetical protein